MTTWITLLLATMAVIGLGPTAVFADVPLSPPGCSAGGGNNGNGGGIGSPGIGGGNGGCGGAVSASEPLSIALVAGGLVGAAALRRYLKKK